MATHFEQQPRVEGPGGAQPARPQAPTSPADQPVAPLQSARGRIAGLVVGSLIVSLAATTLVLRLTRGRQRSSGRRRGAVALVDLQPRVAVFAPTLTISVPSTMTISLPFSGITGQVPPGRNLSDRTGWFACRRGRGPMERHGRGHGRLRRAIGRPA
jgi:hypothetical protein